MYEVEVGGSPAMKMVLPSVAEIALEECRVLGQRALLATNTVVEVGRVVWRRAGDAYQSVIRMAGEAECWEAVAP